jgi:HAD superfamily hydrolase (TIGR01662 family)
VARGEASYRDLQRIQGKLDEEVARHGAYFDRVYFCPHHPESGFPGEVSELKVKCACRKPAPGMIFQAQRELNLDLAECWFIGDTLADIGAAAAANVTSILVLTGLACNIGEYAWQPDFIASDFARAVDLILDIYPLLSRACQPILELIDSGSEWFVAGPSESARRTIIGTLKRELRRRGKPAEVRRLTAERLNGSYGSDRRLTSCSDAVILWEGSTALEFSRDCGMLHHSIWAQDSPGFRDEQIPASEAAYFFDLHEILSPNKTPEGVAA